MAKIRLLSTPRPLLEVLRGLWWLTPNLLATTGTTFNLRLGHSGSILLSSADKPIKQTINRELKPSPPELQNGQLESILNVTDPNPS